MRLMLLRFRCGSSTQRVVLSACWYAKLVKSMAFYPMHRSPANHWFDAC
jgi:hypothetical protein